MKLNIYDIMIEHKFKPLHSTIYAVNVEILSLLIVPK